MVPKVAILKIFKPHLLLNGKSDWAKTRWKALGRHGDSELLKLFCNDIRDGCHSSHLEDLQLLAHLCSGLLTMVHPSSACPSVSFHIFDISIRIIIMMVTMAVILKVFNCYLLPNCKSDGAETWWKSSGQHGDLELLEWFHSDIQFGYRGSHLENVQITSAPEWQVWLSLNLMGGIGVGNSELLKLFCSNIQDGRHSSHLEILQTASPPKLSPIEPKLDGRHWGDMEIQNYLLNRSFPISKMAAMVAMLKLFKQHQILDC